jgi:hypothetical protein
LRFCQAEQGHGSEAAFSIDELQTILSTDAEKWLLQTGLVDALGQILDGFFVEDCPRLWSNRD